MEQFKCQRMENNSYLIRWLLTISTFQYAIASSFGNDGKSQYQTVLMQNTDTGDVGKVTCVCDPIIAFDTQ